MQAKVLRPKAKGTSREELLPVYAVRYRPIQPDYNALRSPVILASVSADGYLRHWNARSGACLSELKCEDDGEENQLFTMDYNPKGSLLAVAGQDKTIRLYDESK